VATAVLLWLLDMLIGLRVDEESELQGLDLALHRERLSG
jgi:Amt family ammonium transporter